MMMDIPLHPLLDENQDGSKKNDHYDATEEPCILTIEKKRTVNQLLGFSLVNQDKYFCRIGHKDDPDQEMSKIDAYKRYYEMLRALVIKDPSVLEMSAVMAYTKHEIEWRY